MNANSLEVSLSFDLPNQDSKTLAQSTEELIAEFADSDVILGLGSLRHNRLGVAFFVSDPSRQNHLSSMITQRVCQAWPGAKLVQSTSTPVSSPSFD